MKRHSKSVETLVKTEGGGEGVESDIADVGDAEMMFGEEAGGGCGG